MSSAGESLTAGPPGRLSFPLVLYHPSADLEDARASIKEAFKLQQYLKYSGRGEAGRSLYQHLRIEEEGPPVQLPAHPGGLGLQAAPARPLQGCFSLAEGSGLWAAKLPSSLRGSMLSPPFVPWSFFAQEVLRS